MPTQARFAKIQVVVLVKEKYPAGGERGIRQRYSNADTVYRVDSCTLAHSRVPKTSVTNRDISTLLPLLMAIPGK
jgi:hypothetical protein